MRFFPLFCSSFLLILFYSCRSQEIFTPNTYEKVYITFGSGGGISGAVSQYYMLEDGKVYRKVEFKEEYTFIGKLEKKLVDQQFDSYKRFQLGDEAIDDPGNMYFFINHSNGPNKLTWGGGNQEVNPIVKNLHLNLTRLVKNLNEKKKSQIKQ